MMMMMKLVHNLNAPTRPGLTDTLKAPERDDIDPSHNDRTGIQFCCGSADYRRNHPHRGRVGIQLSVRPIASSIGKELDFSGSFCEYHVKRLTATTALLSDMGSASDAS